MSTPSSPAVPSTSTATTSSPSTNDSSSSDSTAAAAAGSASVPTHRKSVPSNVSVTSTGGGSGAVTSRSSISGVSSRPVPASSFSSLAASTKVVRKSTVLMPTEPASKLKPPTPTGLGATATHARKTSSGSTSSRDGSFAVTPFVPAAALLKKKSPSTTTTSSPLKTSLPKKGAPVPATAIGSVKARMSVSSAAATPSTTTATTSTPSTPATDGSAADSTAPSAPGASSTTATPTPSTTTTPVKRPSTAGTSAVPSASALAKKRPSVSAAAGLGKPPVRPTTAAPKLSLSSTGGPAALRAAGLGATSASSAVRRTPAVGIKRPVSSAASSVSATRAGHRPTISMSLASPDVLAELATLRTNFASQTATLNRVESELNGAREENAKLRSQLEQANSSESTSSTATTTAFLTPIHSPKSSISAVPSNFGPDHDCSESEYATHTKSFIHQLENRIKNLEQTYQAQREQVEGSMGFAPLLAPGTAGTKPLAQSIKDKKFEETIQDLQFQILYGDTSKDIQLAKLTDQYLQQQQASQQDRLELAKLKQATLRRKEEKVEQWLLQENFIAVM